MSRQISILMTMIGILVLALPTQARIGSPTKIKCDLAAQIYKEDIKELMDINTLLNESTYKKIGFVISECNQYQGKVSTCESVIEQEGIQLRYHFNSQNGGLELIDASTGQSVYMHWTNQYDVTESGYLLGGLWLTNLRGGLMSNPRIFQLEVSCWGMEWNAN